MRQLKDIDIPLSPAEQARLNRAAKAWLERKDPIAKQLTEPEAEKTEERKAEAEKFRRRVLEHNAEMVRREWEAAGLEPRGYSLSLARLLHPESEEAGQGEV